MSTNASGERNATREDAPVVLVVDDDEDLAETCVYWLDAGQYEARVANSGEDALEQMDESVDAILLDRRMPTLSGDEVLEAFRERGYDVPVAMMTAVAPDTDIVDMPFDDYLVKPVSQDDILEAVDEMLARSSFDADVREYFAMSSTEEALAERDAEELRDADELAALRDEITEQYEAYEPVIERREEQLERLTHINTVIREVDRVLVDAESREEIESEVCASLAESAAYSMAWITEYNERTDHFDPRVGAGTDVERVAEESAGVSEVGTRVKDAVTANEVTVVESLSEAHRSAVFGDGDVGESASVVIAPLSYREKTYGALLVYSEREEAFGEQELSVFGELGERIGNGINSVEQRQLLLADTIVELEFRHTDRSDPFVDLSATTGATTNLKGVASTSDSSLTVYVEAANVSGESFLEAATTHDDVADVRLVTEGDPSLLEVTVPESAVNTLASAGATVKTFRVEQGEGRLVAEVAPDADLKALARAVESAYPETSVLSKRRVERSVQSDESFRKDLEDRLTERQQMAMETAFSAGYYEWPRESTAEEVAAAMDISSPTLHEHLRAGERKLLQAFMTEVDEDA
ncbi:response regulator [Halorubellus sp. JP-L1]|uniref:bacterio-opsin activator domain-containing protein n=1 Tax=Halorubellus sp. JP-L1 TaxID=2715753 RepID=UPI00140737FA|nr:bacterio-opsin activator domain-containing protein [Halorubellus sp. JP-L1]NHN40160.1 response regulator [Halorubellus sp. JP-L1]